MFLLDPSVRHGQREDQPVPNVATTLRVGGVDATNSLPAFVEDHVVIGIQRRLSVVLPNCVMDCQRHAKQSSSPSSSEKTRCARRNSSAAVRSSSPLPWARWG